MVELAYDGEALKLSLSDDGVGLDTSAVDASSGHGIRNMRRVAEELGGSLDISSAPGEGTTITLSLPLKEVPAEYSEADDC
jgi:signal transduction histidine kinase